jgi:hypothetical protein
MAQTPPLGVRTSLEVKEALKRAAEEESRSQASLIEKILRDWLREHGYLPAKETKKKGTVG